MSDLHDVLDGAELVRVKDDDRIAQTIGVWHGGHTINYYSVYAYSNGNHPESIARPTLEPTDTQSIGDYETGEVTREEAEEAIEATFERMEEEV